MRAARNHPGNRSSIDALPSTHRPIDSHHERAAVCSDHGARASADHHPARSGAERLSARSRHVHELLPHHLRRRPARRVQLELQRCRARHRQSLRAAAGLPARHADWRDEPGERDGDRFTLRRPVRGLGDLRRRFHDLVRVRRDRSPHAPAHRWARGLRVRRRDGCPLAREHRPERRPLRRRVVRSGALGQRALRGLHQPRGQSRARRQQRVPRRVPARSRARHDRVDQHPTHQRPLRRQRLGVDLRRWNASVVPVRRIESCCERPALHLRRFFCSTARTARSAW